RRVGPALPLRLFGSSNSDAAPFFAPFERWGLLDSIRPSAGRASTNSSGSGDPEPFKNPQCWHSVNVSIDDAHSSVKLLWGDYLCIVSPQIRPSSTKVEWTRRESNPHLRRGQTAVFPLN